MSLLSSYDKGLLFAVAALVGEQWTQSMWASGVVMGSRAQALAVVHRLGCSMAPDSRSGTAQCLRMFEEVP